MIKEVILKRLTIVAIILVICLTTLCVFSGCSLLAKVRGETYVSYVQASTYKTGGFESDQEFTSIIINWYGGSVNLYQYSGDKLIVKENINKDVSDAWNMRWNFWDSSEYGKYYSIKYCAKGSYKFGDLKKDLTILIPDKYTELNHLSITARGECDINIYLPELSYKGDYKGNYNVHLDAEQGNINAVFKDIDDFRMIGDGGKIANQYYRRLHAQNVANIDFVNSYEKVVFELESITGSATIKTFTGDMYIMCQGNVHNLTAENSSGTTYIYANTFDKLDLTGRDKPIGVEMSYKQNFVAKMSNYTLYSSNIAYKEPQFIGRIAYVRDEDLKPDDPDDVYDIEHTGDEWRVHGGKNKYGKDVEVKVMTGAETYFGAAGGQALYTTLKDTGIFYDLPQDPAPYEDPNKNNQQQNDNDPNANQQQQSGQE